MEKREQPLLTVKDVAAYLQVNQTTIYRLLRRSEIPAFKVGGDWRFNIESIDAWRLDADARSNFRSLPEARQLTAGRAPLELYDRAASKTSSLSLMDARDMPAALAPLYQTISQMVAPLAELRATIPIIKSIAHAIDDRRDASGEIARLYEGQTIPFRTHSENLLKFAPIPFAVSDRKHRLVSFNDAFRRLLGFSPRQLRTVAVTDLVHEADLDRFSTMNRQLLTGAAKSGSFVGRGLPAEGAPIVVRCKAWAVHLKPSRKPEYAAGVVERVATQEEASGAYARCAEDLSKRRESVLSRG